MMDTAVAARLAASVRAADPDRYFASLFVPAPLRPLLMALYAFNHEVARVAETVREPMLGAIKLEWWRETVEGAQRGSSRNHDVAKGLAALFHQTGLPLDEFEAIIAARAFDASAEHFSDFAALEAYIDTTGGGVMRLAAAILQPQKMPDEGLRAAARAYGLTGLIRSLGFHNARHKLYLPLDLLASVGLTPEIFFTLHHDARVDALAHQAALRARDYFVAARRAPRPGPVLAALLPAALVPLYLKRLNREVPVHRKQMTLLGAAMRKRI